MREHACYNRAAMMPVLTVTQARWLVGMFGCWPTSSAIVVRDPPMLCIIFPAPWEYARN